MAHQPSDFGRIGVLIAEAECRAIEVIVSHADLSEIATRRIERALATIREGLSDRRDELGIGAASTQRRAHG